MFMHHQQPHIGRRHQRHARPQQWLLLLIATLLAVLFPRGAALAQPGSGSDPDAASTASPLQYMAWVREASDADIHAELERLAAGNGPADPVVAAVHLGLLSSMAHAASAATEQQALAELAAVHDAAGSNPADYMIFADFLHDHLQQRQALRRAATSHQEMDALRHDNLLLQAKIKALTTLEEQLVEREQEKEQEQQAQELAPQPEPEL